MDYATQKLARLRAGVAAGDVKAIHDLGLELFEGIQDLDGRVLVRRNAPYAVRLLRRAVEGGDEGAAFMLGLAYDIGTGVSSNKSTALKWYRRAVRHGDSTAAHNISTVYRDFGDFRRAHRWMLRALEMGDGDAAVTAGYNYLYGIGVRKDVGSARRMFDRALDAEISQYDCEEVLYNQALMDVDAGDREGAIQRLERANKDDDYPEAASLLAQLRSNAGLTPCRCRRHLNKNLLGHAPCPQHQETRRLAARKGRRQ